MIKLIYKGKEYVLDTADVRTIPQYYDTSSWGGYGGFNYITSIPTQELSLSSRTIQNAEEIFDKLRESLCREILEDSIIYDTETLYAFRLDKLILKDIRLDSFENKLSLRGEVSSLQFIENFKPIIRKLGFFDE